MILFIVLAALSATNFTLGKQALLFTSPAFLTGMRMLIASFFWLGGAYLSSSWHAFTLLKRVSWWRLVRIIVVLFSLNYILQFWALHYMASSKVALMASSSPIFAALLSYVTIGESIGLVKCMGLLISFLGLLPTLFNTASQEGATLFWISWPELGLLLSIVGFIYGRILFRSTLLHDKIPIALLTGICMFAGGIISLFVSLGTHYYLHTPLINMSAGSSIQLIGLIAGLVIIGDILCSWLYSYLLTQYSATLVILGEMITPLFVAFYGWLFLGERVGFTFFIAMMAILLGMYLYYGQEQ